MHKTGSATEGVPTRDRATDQPGLAVGSGASITPVHQRSELREITIHRCEVCGHYEGESPQAGCCPKCGTASDSIPVKVKIPSGV